ncbi:hypothetical protein QBC35DRAFT_79444 [Podospora australis]|uniref:Uncharacterized protein n=1 Tax=Podospora australis TaxID=1536484 RepID=A0AAN7AIX5_9PEZI|nr:hypothetical protein QBC35DRAFT_79444 [Podospora australis]
METISNIANTAVTTASKVIWGEKEEPVSGRMGNVAAGQPYDAGNIESSSTALKTTDPNPEVEVSHVETNQVQDTPRKTDLGAKERAFDANGNSAAKQVALPPPTPSEKAQQPSTTAVTTHDTDSGPSSKGDPFTTAVTTHKTEDSAPPIPHADAAATKPSSTLPVDSTKAQNDTRDPSDPTTKPQAVHEKNNIDDADGGLDVNNNPVKIDGPGPRPLEEVAKERGGDAGNVGNDHGDRSRSVGSVSTTEDDNRKHSGTGELYVKSSGLAADGGDFDATKPGAGKEADRLLEQKGIHWGNKTGNDGSAAVGSGQSDKHHHHAGEDHHADHHGEHHEKTSLKEKIKAKLHRKSVS